MNRARTVGIGVAMIVVTALAASCGGDDDTSETLPSLSTTSTSSAPTTTLPPTTTSSTTSTSTTSTSTSTTTTVAPGAVLTLTENGLGSAVFGADPDPVIAYISSILGPPTTDSGWTDPFSVFGTCPGTEVRGVTWDDLTVLFSDESTVSTGRRHFFAYVYGPPFSSVIEPFGLLTVGGVGIASTVSDLRAGHPEALINDGDEFAGPSFYITEGLAGFLTGIGDTDQVTEVLGGLGCGE